MQKKCKKSKKMDVNIQKNKKYFKRIYAIPKD